METASAKSATNIEQMPTIVSGFILDSGSPDVERLVAPTTYLKLLPPACPTYTCRLRVSLVIGWRSVAVTLRLRRRPEVKLSACQPPQSLSGAMGSALVTSPRHHGDGLDQATEALDGLIFGLVRLRPSTSVCVHRYSD
jgi:hypothetical protein